MKLKLKKKVIKINSGISESSVEKKMILWIHDDVPKDVTAMRLYAMWLAFYNDRKSNNDRFKTDIVNNR